MRQLRGAAEAAEEVASEIENLGGRAMTAIANVADARAVHAMIGKVEAKLGRVTVLVNNAGVSHQATLETFDYEQFDRMRLVNVDGIIHATRPVMAGMRAVRYGRIINVASVAAIGTALPGNAFYASTKAEAAILTRRFAMELGPHGITVNAVAPGFVRTDMTQGKRSASEWEAIERRLSERTMMGRIGQPADIANAVLFLASPESSWVTAQILVVDGGRMDYIGHG